MGIDIVTMEDCGSNYGRFNVEGSKGDIYEVDFHGSEGPAYCPCAAFKFSGDKRSCKHIEYVWKNACLYNPQWHDATEKPKIRPVAYNYESFSGNKCECGGPLVYVRRAV